MNITIGKEYKTDIKLGYVDFIGGGNLTAIIQENCLFVENESKVKLYFKIIDRFWLDESDWESVEERSNTPLTGTWESKIIGEINYINFKFEENRSMIGVIHNNYPNTILCHTYISIDRNGVHSSHTWKSTFNLTL